MKNFTQKELIELRQVLISKLSNYEEDKPIKLSYDLDLIDELIFDKYYDNTNTLFKKFSLELNNEILSKIDFSNICFDNFDCKRFNFSLFKGIKINPQTIYEKSLIRTNCNGVEFIGPFDEVTVVGASFKGSIGAKINPQTIYEKILICTKCDGVEFIGPFDGVTVVGTDFRGSTGAKINPQTIHEKLLFSTICGGVEFTGSFDRANLQKSNLEGTNYQDYLQTLPSKTFVKNK